MKGHQDRDRRYADLTQMVLLNVDADAKAGAYQDAHGATRPSIVLMTPLTRAHLIGPLDTVTGNYAEYLREAATAPLDEIPVDRVSSYHGALGLTC